MVLLLRCVGYRWSRRGPHGVATGPPNLTDGCVVSHVGRVEQHGSVACEMWRLCDGRGGYERAVLEYAAV